MTPAPTTATTATAAIPTASGSARSPDAPSLTEQVLALSDLDLDRWATRLYEPLLRRLRADARIDRERRGLSLDGIR